MIDRQTRNQFLRFAVVGVASNLSLYLAFLALTALGMDAKIAMTLLYMTGMIQTFFFNKRWSFRHGGLYGAAFLRYCFAYGAGYAANLIALVVLVDHLGYRHEVVQGVAIIALAGCFFLLQKHWVFRESESTVPVVTRP